MDFYHVFHANNERKFMDLQKRNCVYKTDCSFPNKSILGKTAFTEKEGYSYIVSVFIKVSVQEHGTKKIVH